MNKKLYLTFYSFRHRNYALFFLGQGISLIGTWIQQIAISWLVYKLTNSALLMGVITFCGAIPSLILTPFAGVIIDRVDKYKFLILIQSLFMLEALILAILTLTGKIQIWHIVLISAFIGMTASIDMPLRQSFVIQLVNKSNDLGNAISLNSSMFNLARMIGPAIAGVLIASFGEGVCFLINAISYISVIAALYAMQIDYAIVKESTQKNILEEMLDGVKYALKNPIIKRTLLYLAISSFIGMGYQVLMPIFAKQILLGNAQTLGFLMSASGIGALTGALKLASKRNTTGLEKTIFNASIIFGLALIGLSVTRIFWLALILLFLTGYGMVTIMASSNTLIQHSVSEEKRGRVMSLYTMAFVGTIPIGSLLNGAIANQIGVPYTFLANGIIMLAVAIFFKSGKI